ncbi:MAG: hypothetical protein ACK2UK_01975 [Candidatus Promineifilaceae bacterium]
MTNDDQLREEIAQAAAAESIPVANEGEPETLVVTFEKREDAEAAVRVINKALRKRHDTIYQGALVSLDKDREVQIQDLHDTGLSDVIVGGVGLALDTGIGGFRLLWSTLGAGIFFFGGGWRLLRSTVGRGLALAGTTWTIPRRRRLEEFGAEGHVEPTGVNLAPGGSAVVIVADHETTAELATDLVNSGGELV